MLTLMWSVLLGLSGCAYEVPLDPNAPDILNSISGSVVLSGVEEAATVIVLLYDANDPPPPEGTGAPLTLSTVPGSAFSGASGLLEADYLVSEIPDGDYLVAALMDVDGDFHPLIGSNAGATCGDYAGTYPVSATNLSSAVVSVEGGELVDGVTVVVAQEYPVERPAFYITPGADSVPASGFGGGFELTNTGIASELLEFADPGEECGPLFLIRYTDDDADGKPDPHPLYGANGPFYSAWPKIYLSYTGDGEIGLEEGELYVAEGVIAASSYPDGIGKLLNTTFPSATLAGYFVPGAQHIFPDGSAEIVSFEQVPRGSWSVTVVAETGQTWTVPNALAGYPATDDSFDPALQAGVLTVTD